MLPFRPSLLRQSPYFPHCPASLAHLSPPLSVAIGTDLWTAPLTLPWFLAIPVQVLYISLFPRFAWILWTGPPPVTPSPDRPVFLVARSFSFDNCVSPTVDRTSQPLRSDRASADASLPLIAPHTFFFPHLSSSVFCSHLYHMSLLLG